MREELELEDEIIGVCTSAQDSILINELLIEVNSCCCLQVYYDSDVEMQCPHALPKTMRKYLRFKKKTF
jgi:hypothetical protein